MDTATLTPGWYPFVGSILAQVGRVPGGASPTLPLRRDLSGVDFLFAYMAWWDNFGAERRISNDAR